MMADAEQGIPVPRRHLARRHHGQRAGGGLAGRLSTGVLEALGLVLLAAGLVALAWMPEQATPSEVVWRMALYGLGFGCFQSPNNAMLIRAAPIARSGAASGMLGTARMIGRSLDAAPAALLLATLGGAGERSALVAAAAIALLAAAISVTRAVPGREGEG